MADIRPHLWHRELRADETAAAVVTHDYPHALPRLLHKDGDHKRVDTPEQCDTAIADGWKLSPNESSDEPKADEPKADFRKRR